MPLSVAPELMPRMLSTAPVPVAVEPIITCGASSARLLKLVASLFSSSSLVMGATATGTSCSDSDVDAR